MAKTLVIGRSPFADVIIADATVAPHHLELVIADNGLLHATDCATANGTWRLLASERGDAASPRAGASAGGATGRAPTGDGTQWVRIRQVFVTADTPLRLGDYHCTVGDLLAQARSRPAEAVRSEGGGDGWRGDGWRPAGRSGPPARGRVERDAHTGEIVRRRP